jgi:hypothetical protein
MGKAEEIIALLENEMLPEIEDFIDEMFEKIAAKKGTADIEDAVKDAQEVRADLKEILEDAKSDELEEVELEQILKQLTAMHNGEELDDEDWDDEA